MIQSSSFHRSSSLSSFPLQIPIINISEKVNFDSRPFQLPLYPDLEIPNSSFHHHPILFFVIAFE